MIGFRCRRLISVADHGYIMLDDAEPHDFGKWSGEIVSWTSATAAPMRSRCGPCMVASAILYGNAVNKF